MMRLIGGALSALRRAPPGWLFAGLLLAAGIVGAAAFARTVRDFYASAASLPRFAVPISTLDFENFPSWVSPAMAAELRGVHGVREPFSVFDSAKLREIHERYRRNPWVREVGFVRRRFPNRIEVSLVFRRPFAYVRTAGGSEVQLVDEEGVRVSAAAYPFAADPLGLPLIEGIRSAAPRIGSPWGRPLDAGVRTGIYLARVLESEPALRRWEVRRIDLAGLGQGGIVGEKEVVLRTKTGARILWGKGPFSAGAPDLTVGEKLRVLRTARIPDLSRLDYVSVRTAPPTVCYLRRTADR